MEPGGLGGPLDRARSYGKRVASARVRRFRRWPTSSRSPGRRGAGGLGGGHCHNLRAVQKKAASRNTPVAATLGTNTRHRTAQVTRRWIIDPPSTGR
jgi:hypothetical protein